MIYFVSTPIGNLKDITLRALEVLKDVDVIACEDTRTSAILLNHYGINSAKLISHHKFNEQESSDYIISLSENGKNVAIISDAGMPVISDPGNCLTKKLALKNMNFTVLPGANAALSALVLSGFDSSSFHFFGFLPEKSSQRKNVLTELSLIKSTIIFYVSPHNLEKDLEEIYKVFGEREAALVKEISKVHETVYRFKLGCNFNEIKIDPKGEFVLIVSAPKDTNDELLNETILNHVRFYINLGLSKNEAIKKVAKERKINKNTVYQEVLNL